MSERQTDPSAGRRARIRAAVAVCVFALLALCLILFQPDDLYPWIKALHIIAVISWMAGLLYMPRLFLYHLDAPVGSVQSETFKVMEARLMAVIMRPAMATTWALGLYLAWSVYGFQGGWLHAKLAAVVVLSGFHEHFAASVKAFGRDERRHSPRYWRLMNEGPTVLMILIVILVVVKPF